MKRAVWCAVWLVAAGCSTHSTDPRNPYDDPANIPVVENVAVIPGPGGDFNLTWEYEDSIFNVVDGFYVERAPYIGGAPAGAFQRLNDALIQRRDFEDLSGLPEGGYVYRVVSQTGAGVTRSSAWAVGYVDLDPPDPPVLSAELLTGQVDGVRLSWTEPAEDVVGYRVFRSPEFFQGLLFIEVTENFLEDYGLTPGVTYSYWVKAVDRGLNESAHSNIVAVQIRP